MESKKTGTHFSSSCIEDGVPSIPVLSNHRGAHDTRQPQRVVEMWENVILVVVVVLDVGLKEGRKEKVKFGLLSLVTRLQIRKKALWLSNL